MQVELQVLNVATQILSAQRLQWWRAEPIRPPAGACIGRGRSYWLPSAAMLPCPDHCICSEKNVQKAHAELGDVNPWHGMYGGRLPWHPSYQNYGLVVRCRPALSLAAVACAWRCGLCSCCCRLFLCHSSPMQWSMYCWGTAYMGCARLLMILSAAPGWS